MWQTLAFFTAAAVLLVLAVFNRRRRRAQLLSAPLPAPWRTILERQPCFRRLPADLRRGLPGRMNVFMAEKRFEGCGGLTLTDEMRVIIAAQACLPLLGGAGDHYPGVTTILVYPRDFPVEETKVEEGFELTGEETLSGESWQQGTVILSWDSVLGDADDAAFNVVVHEFAHQLDEEDGMLDGVPLLRPGMDYDRWVRVFQEAYDDLVRRSEAGEDTVLDPYGTYDAVEFFAVASEAFFEVPRELKAEHPDMYGELAGFYGLDPGEWG
ncbi:MAG: M90 family metallopeptidase [Planctomycetota bacterium]